MSRSFELSPKKKLSPKKEGAKEKNKAGAFYKREQRKERVREIISEVGGGNVKPWSQRGRSYERSGKVKTAAWVSEVREEAWRGGALWLKLLVLPSVRLSLHRLRPGSFPPCGENFRSACRGHFCTAGIYWACLCWNSFAWNLSFCFCGI